MTTFCGSSGLRIKPLVCDNFSSTQTQKKVIYKSMTFKFLGEHDFILSRLEHTGYDSDKQHP